MKNEITQSYLFLKILYKESDHAVFCCQMPKLENIQILLWNGKKLWW